MRFLQHIHPLIDLVSAMRSSSSSSSSHEAAAAAEKPPDDAIAAPSRGWPTQVFESAHPYLLRGTYMSRL
jgi:hypothetical protein